MSNLKYEKISLFDAPPNSILVHACNSKGVWGSGIAKEFKERYPRAFKEYNEFCEYGVSGESIVSFDNYHFIGNLITSSGYADTVDNHSVILVNTTLALHSLVCTDYCKINTLKIYSNKFNSGLFKVPWEETEAILKVFVERYNLDWTICDPSL